MGWVAACARQVQGCRHNQGAAQLLKHDIGASQEARAPREWAVQGTWEHDVNIHEVKAVLSMRGDREEGTCVHFSAFCISLSSVQIYDSAAVWLREGWRRLRWGSTKPCSLRPGN